MAVIENRLVCDLSKPVQAQALKGNVFSLDNLGSRISVLIYDNGQPATISGSVTANCILPDGSTVDVNGSLTTENGGSKAYVDIPQSCLLISGILKIAIKCTSSSVITTLAAIVANVYMTKTDNVITPSQQIITDWNAEISSSLANQDAKISDIKSALVSITGNVIYENWVGPKKYIALNGETADISNPATSSGNCQCMVISASEGDVFTITATGGSASRVYGFVASSTYATPFAVLGCAKANETISDKAIICPADTAYLVVNDTTYAGKIYGKRTVNDSIKSLEEDRLYNSNEFVFSDYVFNSLLGPIGIMASSEYSESTSDIRFAAYNAMNDKKDDPYISEDGGYFFTSDNAAWWRISLPCKINIKKVKIKNSYSTSSSFLLRSFDVLADNEVIGHIRMSSAFEEKEIDCDVWAKSLTVQSDEDYPLGIGHFEFEYAINETLDTQRIDSIQRTMNHFYPVSSNNHWTKFGKEKISASSQYGEFAPWKACNGVIDTGEEDSNYFFTNDDGAWWKIKLPCKIKLSGIKYVNSHSDARAYLTRNFDIYVDDNMTQKYGETVVMTKGPVQTLNFQERFISDEPVVTDVVIIKSDDSHTLGMSDVELLYTDIILPSETQLYQVGYLQNAITSNDTMTVYGLIQISASSYYQSDEIFAPWKAMDGTTDVSGDGHYYFTGERGAWWKVKYPYKMHIHKLIIQNSYSTVSSYLGRKFAIYADDEKQILIASNVEMTTAWQTVEVETDILTDTILIQSDETYLLGLGDVTICSTGLIFPNNAFADTQTLDIYSKALKGNTSGSAGNEQIIYQRTGQGMIYNIQLIGPTKKYPNDPILLKNFDKVVLRVYTDEHLYFSGTIFELCGMGSDNHNISDYDNVTFYTPLFSKMGTRSNIILNYKIPYYSQVKVALYYPAGLDYGSFKKWVLVKDNPEINISYGGKTVPYGAYLYSEKIRNTNMPFGGELTLIDTNKNGMLLTTSVFVQSGNAYFQEGCVRGYFGNNVQVLSSGLEDYFGFCHYFDIGAKQFPMNGATYFESNSDTSPTTLCAYRNHIDDIICFSSGGFQFKVRCGDADGPVTVPSASDRIIGVAPDNTDYGAQVTYYTWDDV